MSRSIVIERFKLARQSGWEGEIHTLTIDRQIRFVPNDNQTNGNSPTFRVMLGWQHVGDASGHLFRGAQIQPYLRIRMDNPICPLRATLFPNEKGASARVLMLVTRTDGWPEKEDCDG